MTTEVGNVPERGAALAVDKPAGPTSHDIVTWARRSVGVRRIGHTGTLDPFASGLLILLIGPATRLSEYVSGLPKVYSARALLGVSTDTDDARGQAVETGSSRRMPARAEVEEELSRFLGQIQQVPPQFSAKKIDGEPMYKKARRGEVVDLAPVDVEISRIQVTEFNPPEVTFEVACSGGTYIRALARDLGERLGVGAHLTALRRLSVGNITVEHAMPGGDLREGYVPTPAQWLDPVEAVGHLRAVRVPGESARRFRYGESVSLPEADLEAGPPIAVLDDMGLVGIGEVRDERLAPRKVLVGLPAS